MGLRSFYAIGELGPKKCGACFYTVTVQTSDGVLPTPCVRPSQIRKGCLRWNLVSYLVVCKSRNCLPTGTRPVTTNCEIFNAEEEGTEDVVLHLMKTNRLVSRFLPSFYPLQHLRRRRSKRNGGPTVLCAERLLALSLPFGAFSAFCLLCRHSKFQILRRSSSSASEAPLLSLPARSLFHAC